MKVTINLTKQEAIDALLQFYKHTGASEIIISDEQVETDDEWISNIGRDDCSHPESLDSKTKLEVKYRYCETATGYADDWDACWKATDGDPLDIVAYRIIK